jgi:metal transporter CNNM
MDSLAWFGIAFCVTQSAIFSGLNLAFFSLSRMQLDIDAEHGVKAAQRILTLRQDSNFLLTTILWGNVGINVLLTLISNSVMTGLAAFLFSTIIITFLGEIIPQAYFSRNAMRMGSLLAPVLKFYQFVLYPVAKPTAWVLDRWLGKEGIDYLRERDLKAVIKAHIEAEEAEVDHLEGIGAMNFLAIDDLTANDEGEEIDPKSILQLPSKVDFPIIPSFERDVNDSFLKSVDDSGQSWVILTDNNNKPLLALDADGFLRDAVFNTDQPCDPYDYCHRPIVTLDPDAPLGELIFQLKINEKDNKHHDGVITDDVILLWGEQKKIITGGDILGRLLKGVSSQS